MFSRAHLLIAKDYQTLKTNELWGIECSLISEENYFEWIVKLCGIKDTDWEGAIFRLYVKFDEYYNDSPPKICFHTIPFHPNVDAITGEIGVDFLLDELLWRPGYDLTFVLLTIQSLLSKPELDKAVNQEAADLYVYHPAAYLRRVHDCVVASQQLEAAVRDDGKNCSESEHRMKETKTVTETTRSTRQRPTRNKIAFDDYHETWSGIATSQPTSKQLARYENERTFLGVRSDSNLHKNQKSHQNQLRAKVDEKQQKLDKLNRMRALCLQQRPAATVSDNTIMIRQSNEYTDRVGDIDGWENEVDDLVSWTNQLDVKPSRGRTNSTSNESDDQL